MDDTPSGSSRPPFATVLGHELPGHAAALAADRIILGEADHPRRSTGDIRPAVYNTGHRIRSPLPTIRYVVSGDIDFKLDNRLTYRLHEGDFCFVSRMTEHYGRDTGKGQPYRVFVFAFYFLDRMYVTNVENDGHGNHAVTAALHTRLTPGLMRESYAFFRELEHPDVRSTDRARIYLQSFLQCLKERIAENRYYIHDIRSAGKKWGSKNLELARQYIREHMADTLTVDEVAREININPKYLITRFKEEYGSTMMEYHNILRLRTAIKHMEQPGLTLSEIAFELGFRDVYYFSKLFKRYYGIAPKFFRERYIL